MDIKLMFYKSVPSAKDISLIERGQRRQTRIGNKNFINTITVELTFII